MEAVVREIRGGPRDATDGYNNERQLNRMFTAMTCRVRSTYDIRPGLLRPNERKGKTMLNVTKIAAGSLAMLLLGSAAALAQPYGYGGYNQNFRRCYEQPYGSSDCVQLRQTPAFEAYRQANAANITGYIVDPATGQPITEQAYLARYPGSNPGTWQYNASTNLWVDLTAQQYSQQSYAQPQYYGRYRGPRGR